MRSLLRSLVFVCAAAVYGAAAALGALALFVLLATDVFAQAPSDTVVSLGDSLGAILSALLLALGVPIAGLVVNLLVKLAQGIGVSVADARKAQLQEVVVNGIHWAAARLQPALAGRLTVDVRNRLVADVLRYVQAHGVDILKALGVDPNSADLKTAIEARVERALNDPATPTPANVTPAALTPAV